MSVFCQWVFNLLLLIAIVNSVPGIHYSPHPEFNSTLTYIEKVLVFYRGSASAGSTIKALE